MLDVGPEEPGLLGTAFVETGKLPRELALELAQSVRGSATRQRLAHQEILLVPAGSVRFQVR